MKFIYSCLALLFVSSSFAYEVIDDHGQILQFKEPPKRIVSMLPSITESVCILGRCAQLIGVDRYSNWPKSITNLPKLGGGLDPNIEAIISLNPDLVLVGSSPRASERMKSLGIPVFSLDSKSYADVRRTIEKLALILGVPKRDAQKIWDDIDLGVEKASKLLPPGVAKAKVYFEVNRAPYAAGPNSFIGETLGRLGLVNIMPASLGPFPKISPEFVVSLNPDVIMVGDRNYIGMNDRPGWAQLDAIKNGNVCVFKESDADVIIRPGPRMAEGAMAIVDCLSSKKFLRQTH
ncbi:ABC transporter substrate-binding protein [Polynucleobacter sp. 15G-AUS-farblos]|uniref:ABC transporter substrate-binding protein n=1 Tax=Polynucleobacter sp. 15G-AUS-farblos TaxID=2689094 RepID=UPI001C0AC74B|nr:helical backbone metal receptor [Polynucleobacter sp. 15G-AUS-farblos]MBU3583317.1 ABC transporter substrate-binding protein [Polynucleobacter sp. 15G-AUS-farblos]